MTDLGSLLADPLFQRLGWTLAAFLLQGTLVAALLACINALARGRRPEIRYGAACGALVLMAALPIATFLDHGPGPVAPGRAARAGAADSPAETSAARPRVASGEDSAASLVARTIRATASSLTPWLVPAWIAGVLFLSLRFLAGCAAARRLRCHGIADAPAALRATLERVAGRVRLSRPVLLLRSARVVIPTTLGAFRPAILLPVSALTGLSPEALEAVLAHELAHIRRHDYLVNLLQTAVETLLFYHPAVWWASHRIRVERENCCDDLAVQATGDVRAYARALVGLEEMRSAPTPLAVAANGGTLWNRVQRLVPAPASPAEGASRWLAAVLALATVGTLGAVARISALGEPSADRSPFQTGTSCPARDRGGAPRAALAGVGGGVEGGTGGGVSGGVAGGVRGAVAGGVAGGVARGTSDGVAGGVGGGVAGGVPEAIDGGPDEDAEEETKEDVPPKEGSNGGDGRLSAEDLAELRAHGVTPELLGSLAALGYKRATVDDLVSVRVHGVTPEYISEMDRILGRLSLDELVSLKIHGVTADFVGGFRAAGYEGLSADEALSLRIHGVSPEAATEWTKILPRRPGLDEILSARIHGVTPEFARETRSLGFEADLDTLVGVRIHGVTAEFIKEIQSLGYKSVSLDELTSLRIHGVTPEFIRKANRSGNLRLSIDELLDLRIHGRTR